MAAAAEGHHRCQLSSIHALSVSGAVCEGLWSDVPAADAGCLCSLKGPWLLAAKWTGWRLLNIAFKDIYLGTEAGGG